MLCLSRKLDEQIMIGDDIIVTVIDIRGDRVRLGITAPADVPVNREEIYCRVLNKTGRDRIGPRLVPPPDRLDPEQEEGDRFNQYDIDGELIRPAPERLEPDPRD